MKPELKLYEHQLKAIQDIQENGLEVGRIDVLCSLVGRSFQAGGKTNRLQFYLNSLRAEDRERFLASVRIISPMGDAITSSEQLAEMFREAEERIQKSMTVMVSPDVHVAISGGGQVSPRPIDLHAALDGRTIHIEYDGCGGWPSKNALGCAERPNTTDMFRMFRDHCNKPKRGKK